MLLFPRAMDFMEKEVHLSTAAPPLAPSLPLFNSARCTVLLVPCSVPVRLVFVFLLLFKVALPPHLLGQVGNLMEAWMGMQKLATTPFPFPYIQLLVTLLFLYTYTQAITVTLEYQWIGIVVTAVISYALFGLHAIGSELEVPLSPYLLISLSVYLFVSCRTPSVTKITISTSTFSWLARMQRGKCCYHSLPSNRTRWSLCSAMSTS